jgi:hypothetical protein
MLPLENFLSFFRLTIIDIAKCHDIYFGTLRKLGDITCTFSSNSNTSNIQFITWSNEATTQYMSRHNEKARANHCTVRDKFAARHAIIFLERSHVLFFRKLGKNSQPSRSFPKILHGKLD